MDTAKTNKTVAEVKAELLTPHKCGSRVKVLKKDARHIHGRPIAIRQLEHDGTIVVGIIPGGALGLSYKVYTLRYVDCVKYY